MINTNNNHSNNLNVYCIGDRQCGHSSDNGIADDVDFTYVTSINIDDTIDQYFVSSNNINILTNYTYIIN